MDFSPQQAKALTEVGQWLKTGPQVYRLFGYAGTGKTTIAKHLASLQNGEVLFAAFTGKAASVLTRKGCPASTIHSLVYRPQETDDKKIKDLQQQLELPGVDKAQVREKIKLEQQPKFVKNEQSPLNGAKLLIVDEVSMVNEQIGVDLLSFGVKILVLGDPGQLPPIEGTGYFTSEEPNLVLTEIHRQAQGNPVINMATQVRNGSRLRPGRYGNSKVLGRHELIPEDLLEASQVIVGLNRTRRNLNGYLRDKRGFVGAVPCEGERLICLRNNHEVGLLNGTQWKVQEVEDKGLFVDLELVSLDLPRDEPLRCSAHHFDVDLGMMQSWQRRQYNEFDYGYVITCHKAQGSQWPHVFIKNESFAFREDSARWLYTALTRAEERVTIVL